MCIRDRSDSVKWTFNYDYNNIKGEKSSILWEFGDKHMLGNEQTMSTLFKKINDMQKPKSR